MIGTKHVQHTQQADKETRLQPSGWVKLKRRPHFAWSNIIYSKCLKQEILSQIFPFDSLQLNRKIKKKKMVLLFLSLQIKLAKCIAAKINIPN